MNKYSKYEELINYCLDIIKTYNPIVETVDSHADEYLKKVLKLIKIKHSIFLV